VSATAPLPDAPTTPPDQPAAAPEPGEYSFVVVASRLPVDRTQGPGGGAQW
jgi:hypothetical protein